MVHGQSEATFETDRFIRTAKEYKFHAPEGTDFSLREQPIMVWSNPATFDQKGVVLVWTDQSRPQVVATLFESTHPDGVRIMFEAHALARGPMEGYLKENRFWNVEKPGVTFQTLTDTAPLATGSRRQLQMRQLAREYQVVLTDDTDNKTTLRLLPTPVLTYEPNTDQCIDGALFAFAATGTDPDAFLLVETIRDKNALRFQVAFARFHFRELTATRKEQMVWHVDADLGMLNNFRGNTKYRSSVYNFFRIK